MIRDMSYDLYIGDRTFSSWSLRGWLMFEKFELPVNTHFVGLYSGTMQTELAHLTPARTVPVVQTADGHILTDSIAISETLVEQNPQVTLYPRDPAARALARSMVAEMHCGFGALRDACPMMLSFCWDGFEVSDAVSADLARIEMLWALARERHGAAGPWLFGEYSLADVFYAPVAMRITGYDLPVSADARSYVDQHLQDPALGKWRELAMQETHDPFPYLLPLQRKPWPGDPR